MKLNHILLFSLLLIGFRVSAQEMVVAKFAVESGNLKRNETPVSISLEKIDYNTDKGALRLFEMF